MEIFVRGDKIKVTKSIQDYAQEKLGRIEKYLGDSANVRATVVVNVKGHRQKVEVTIPLKTVILRAEETREAGQGASHARDTAKNKKTIR